MISYVVSNLDLKSAFRKVVTEFAEKPNPAFLTGSGVNGAFTAQAQPHEIGKKMGPLISAALQRSAAPDASHTGSLGFSQQHGLVFAGLRRWVAKHHALKSLKILI
jgi:hypothetical protein